MPFSASFHPPTEPRPAPHGFHDAADGVVGGRPNHPPYSGEIQRAVRPESQRHGASGRNWAKDSPVPGVPSVALTARSEPISVVVRIEETARKTVREVGSLLLGSMISAPVRETAGVAHVMKPRGLDPRDPVGPRAGFKKPSARPSASRNSPGSIRFTSSWSSTSSPPFSARRIHPVGGSQLSAQGCRCPTVRLRPALPVFSSKGIPCGNGSRRTDPRTCRVGSPRLCA